LQEILQICIIILNCKRFFDSTLIFIILFARNSLNKALNYLSEIHKKFFEFSLIKKTSIQNINSSSTFTLITSIFFHHDI